MRIRAYTLLAVLVSFSISCISQSFEYRNIQRYVQSDGLSSYNVRTILKDKRQYVWVGTQNGLSRFDGLHFQNYTVSSEEKKRICGVDIRALVEDTLRNLLWVLPNEGGLNAIDINRGTVVRHASIPDIGSEGWGMSMLMHEGNLWLGLSSGLRIYDIDRDRFAPAPPLPPASANVHDFEVRSLIRDCRKNIWVFFSGYGIVIYNGKNAAIIKCIPLSYLGDHRKTSNIRFNNSVSLNDSELLLGTSQGLRKVSFDDRYNINVNSTPIVSPAARTLNTVTIDGLCRTSDSTVIVASRTGLFRLNGLASSCIIQEAGTAEAGDWTSSVQTVFYDDQQNCWLGCQQGLAYFNAAPTPFRGFYRDISGSKRLEHVRSLHSGSDGTMFVGLRNGIATWDVSSKRCTIADQTQLYHHIWRDFGSNTLASTADGIFVLTRAGKRPIQEVYREFGRFKSAAINSHISIGDSLMVLGTENDQGILLWSPLRHAVKRIGTTTPVTPLASDIVNNIFRDASSRLWVLSDHAITIIAADWSGVRKLVLRNPATKRELNLFFDVCEANGSYWVASYGNGVVQLSSELAVSNMFTSKSGLSDNGVYQVFSAAGHVVITSDNGLSVLDLSTRRFKRYYQEDGLHSNNFEEVAGTMKDGLIYAGGVKGFTVINPSGFAENTLPPSVYINRILVERPGEGRNIDTSDLELHQLNVPDDALQTTLFFSGINYSRPARTTFAYRIREINEGWVDLGNHSFLSLTALAPGTYHLDVKAANEDNVWSRPEWFTLYYLPKWYQTWWFNALLIAGALGLGLAFYRMRINQILKQQKIRKDVASDLHDDIGSNLNSVKVFTHLAISDPSRIDYIKKAQENLEHATLGLRDMIWILDDKLDSIDDLCSRLSRFATPTGEALGISMHFRVEEIIRHRRLPKPWKRNLLSHSEGRNQ